jgi:peptidoglycan/xylan/chitin deacetylase (PgdA/CDA1 family)
MPGVTIGSHGTSHSKLTACSDKQLHDELCDSKAFLEDLLQKKIDTLSYPHGAVDKRVMDFVADSGYRLAATSRFGTNRVGQHPLNLKRTDIWSTDSTSDLNSKIRGNWDWMETWS